MRQQWNSLPFGGRTGDLPGHDVEGEIHGGVLGRGERHSLRGLDQRGEQCRAGPLELPRPVWVGHPGRPGRGVQRVEPGGQPRADVGRLAAEPARQPGVLAFGITGDRRLVTERGSSRDQGLEQGGLARADRAEHREVRVLDDLLAVELEHVEDEGVARPDMAPDVHPGRAEAGVHDERVDAGDLRGRLHVGRQP